jgi:hypothetical protein
MKKHERNLGIWVYINLNETYEKLDPEILSRFKYTECRSPLIIPAAFNKEGDSMMEMLQIIKVI